MNFIILYWPCQPYVPPILRFIIKLRSIIKLRRAIFAHQFIKKTGEANRSLILLQRVTLRRRLVPRRGLEPLQDFSHSHLKAACLPVSPPRHTNAYTIVVCSVFHEFQIREKCSRFPHVFQTLITVFKNMHLIDNKAYALQT